MSTNTQVSLVLKHLEDGKSITPAHSLVVYGISRLASVIEDIRKLGYEVDTLMKRDEMGKQYGEYRLRRAIVINTTVQVKPGHGIGLPNWVRKLRNAQVVGKPTRDASLVRFARGGNLKDIQMLDRELVNVA